MKLSNKSKDKNGGSSFSFAARVMCIILALLMVMGSCVLLIQFLFLSSNAYYEGQYADETMVRVGLMYGSDVTVGFETTTDHGFEMGSVDSENNYKVLWQVTDTCVSVTCDSNLAKNGMSYYLSSSGIVIGAYHLSVYSTMSKEDAEQQVANYNSLIESAGYAQLGMYAFPAYTDGMYYVYIGNYPSLANANSASASLSYIGITQATVVSGSTRSVSLVNPNTDRILFEFDSYTGLIFGMTPIQSGTETSYIVTPAKNTYSGIFCYTRYYAENTSGIQVVNLLPLEEYIEGVLPWEINNQWPIEAQKSFAVTVRSYTLTNLGRHGKDDFDICNTTHCQLYKGRNRVNENVVEAVSGTKDMVLTYNGKIASTYYSSSCGGSTVSVNEAWQGSSIENYPYLAAIATPWENYEHYNNGSWTAEVTPEKLCQTLRDNGYTELNRSIASVKINKLATNSTYVFSITFTDMYGTSVTIEYTDRVRTSLSGIVKSANFVVAKAGETVEIINYVPVDGTGNALPTSETTNETTAETTNETTSETTNGTAPEMNLNATPTAESWYGDSSSSGGVHVLTSDGEEKVSVQEYINIERESGRYSEVNIAALQVITGTGIMNYDMASEVNREYIEEDDDEWAPETGDSGVDYINTNVTTETVTVTADGTPGNFVFIGRGWGHGVGISQYGNRDLAEMGYTYDQILNLYFQGTEIKNYKTLQY